jgi:hypothetical protein
VGEGKGGGGGGGVGEEGSCGVMILVVSIPAGRPCHTGNRVHILSFSFLSPPINPIQLALRSHLLSLPLPPNRLPSPTAS